MERPNTQETTELDEQTKDLLNDIRSGVVKRVHAMSPEDTEPLFTYPGRNGDATLTLDEAIGYCARHIADAVSGPDSAETKQFLIDMIVEMYEKTQEKRADKTLEASRALGLKALEDKGITGPQ